MKRLRGWLFNLAAAVSLGLAIISMGSWLYCLSHVGVLRFCVKDREVALLVYDGSVFISTANANRLVGLPPGKTQWPLITIGPDWGSSYASPDGIGALGTEQHYLGFGIGVPRIQLRQYREMRVQVMSRLPKALQLLGTIPPSDAKTKLADQIAIMQRALLPANEWRIQFPLWCYVLLFGVLPAVWIYRYFLRQRRIAQGFCSQCGYDLRATPERCPECGTVPEAAKEAAP